MPSIADVVKRLEELTTSRKLQWSRIEPPDSIAVGTDSKILAFFTATFNGRHVGIYEERYRGFDIDSETSYWTSREVLVFFDISWDVTWEAPTTPGIARLYDAIKYQKADVDTIMNDILIDNNEEESFV
ncbi:MAG TPA: hypothetical protein VF584_02695 [Longimicrobium sp.]|jgi:hypothetical protein